MTTFCIICAVTTAVCAVACGVLCALYKHEKRKK